MCVSLRVGVSVNVCSVGLQSISVPVCLSVCVPEPKKLCKFRGGRPGLPVPNSPYGLWT